MWFASMAANRSSSVDARLARESAYWDSAYRPDGAEHDKYLWIKNVERRSHVGGCFLNLAMRCYGKRILSLGGGIDSLAVALAKADNRIVSVDISPVAVAATAALARHEGVADKVTALVSASERIELPGESFDIVLSKRALHHMDVGRTVARARDLLVDGGLFVAEEPICLSAVLQWVHRTFPFHPSAPRTPDERELTADDLALIAHTFRDVRTRVFDCLTRESVAYALVNLRMEWLLSPLGRLDDLLLNTALPMLRGAATYAIIEARK